jgi:parallel beta-helix repeat protein
MKHLIFSALILLGAATNAWCKSYLVHNEKELEDILPSLKAGDKVRIANGTYSPWSITIGTTATAKKPLIIEAETKGKVIFTGDVGKTLFKLTGSYIILRGITFASCNLVKAEKSSGLLVELSGSQHCRLTECDFIKAAAKKQYMPLVIVSGEGEHNRVDHCTFSNNVDNMDVQVRVTKSVTPQHTLVDNNLFKDKNPVSWKNGNGGECVQIGQDPILLGNVTATAIVRENRFIRCNGEPEVISNKSSGNQYIKNQLEDCIGEIVMRGGHDCIVDGNTIKGGSSGIRVNGTGHRITNNRISNVKTGIRLMYGMTKSKTETGFYVAAGNCIISNNRLENTETGIFIGGNKNNDWTGKFDTKRYPSRVMQDVAPYDNTLEGNVFVHAGNEVVRQ